VFYRKTFTSQKLPLNVYRCFICPRRFYSGSYVSSSSALQVDTEIGYPCVLNETTMMIMTVKFSQPPKGALQVKHQEFWPIKKEVQQYRENLSHSFGVNLFLLPNIKTSKTTNTDELIHYCTTDSSYHHSFPSKSSSKATGSDSLTSVEKFPRRNNDCDATKYTATDQLLSLYCSAGHLKHTTGESESYSHRSTVIVTGWQLVKTSVGGGGGGDLKVCCSGLPGHLIEENRIKRDNGPRWNRPWYR